MDQRVLRVIAFMSDNLRREIMSVEIARSVNLSYSQLRHVFTMQTGIPPMQYLKILRLQEATLLLETTFLSIKEIAAKVGLKDESHFVRDFKKVNGWTPRQHRQMHQLGEGRENVSRSDYSVEAASRDDFHSP